MISSLMVLLSCSAPYERFSFLLTVSPDLFQKGALLHFFYISLDFDSLAPSMIFTSLLCLLSKIGLDPRNHIHSSNSMVITEISIFTVSKAKRGASPHPFGGGVQKSLVQNSKALSKMGLNPENHVYSSNRMAITEYLFLLYKA